MSINTAKLAFVGLLAAGLIASCAEGADDAGPVNAPTADGVNKQAAGDGKGDAWNWRNNPTHFRSELNYKFSELPIEGYSQRVAWADTHWPTYEDSINARWQGQETLSPAEKYDTAFNEWSAPEGFMELEPYDSSSCSWDEEYYTSLGPAALYTSRNKGNWTSHNGVDDDGDGLSDKEECGYDDENKDRDGVESWWGLCHAWVPAAMLEDEPLRPVTRNGVTFEVSDLKGLLIAQYDRADAYMLGGRCNDKEVERDEETGRVITEGCRDVNAGSFHVIVTNFLGVQQRAIAEDRTYNYEVWNQPVTGYKITAQREISLEEAHELLEVKQGPSEDDQADGESGGEPSGEPSGDVEDDQQGYVYNDRAEKLIEIKLTTDYVTESSASTRPNGDHIERYTRHDDYNYILELDANGDIIGGEWVGSSIQNHPDFLWLPTRARSGNPHIDIELVRELIAESRLDPDAEEPTDGPSGDPAENKRRYTSADSVAIPDNDPVGAVSAITVAERGVVKGLSIDLDIEHTYRGDLIVELRHDGTTVLVYNGQDDSPAWEDNVSLEGELVTGFEGLNIEGDWELVVSDNARVDTGTITSWALDFEMVTDVPAPDVDLEEPGEEPTDGLIEAENTDSLAIPDSNEAGATSVVTINEAGTVDQLIFGMDITHSYAGDLLVTLTHGETSVTVFDGDQLDDGSVDDVHLGDELLEAFAGRPIQGDWTLEVVDRAKYDTGTLDAWRLSIVRQ
jgi:subtilisin-like proprotein convertase family protein